MKVLFAVNNEKVSNSIIKKYQADYKEIISAKNVYYFNAIIKELQKDKSYDRVVISEDLEPFSNKNYDMIDKFLFDKLDSISDEASNSIEGEIPIVLICTDRREKGNQLLVKLFSLGVYSALIGADRTIDNVCNLIYKPRTKKEAKLYYKIDYEDLDGYRPPENPEDVSETEIQNILTHFKKLGRNEDAYVSSFNNIAEQYTDEQLKLIIRFFPLNVKAVLEEKSPKYQSIMIGSVKGQIKAKKEEEITTVNIKPKTDKIDLIDKELSKNRMTKPVIIPSTVNMSNVRKVYTQVQENVDNTIKRVGQEEKTQDPAIQNELDTILNLNTSEKTEQVDEPIKKGRGRPKKNVEEVKSEYLNTPKRGRGRPKKIDDSAEYNLVNNSLNSVDNKQNNSEDSTNILPGLEDNSVLPGLENNTVLPGLDSENILPGLNDDNNELPGLSEEKPLSNDEQNMNILPGLDDDDDDYSNTTSNFNMSNNSNNKNSIFATTSNNYTSQQNSNTATNAFSSMSNESDKPVQTQTYTNNIELTRLLTSDKKIVSFVGTSKNGTSFLVNNLAAMLSAKGINTAILDLTKNKNAYYIYTQNKEELRNISSKCIENLRRGVDSGIPINKNLFVYTTPPNEDMGIEDVGNILKTLINNHSLVLLDCDFDTNYEYFKESQEIYLVQSYDVLTIQPLTAFLRELADRNILEQNKIRIVLNKVLRVKNLTDKMIIGGISSYNDPSMSYMKELFDKDSVIYTTIPFEDETYSKYLEGMVTCEISLNGYSKGLLDSLNKLGDIVYPLINNSRPSAPQYGQRKEYGNHSQQNAFNSNINSTLNKMRNNNF